MLRHYLVLALRNIRRFKSVFFINLTGLSTGIACTLMIYLWINDELSVDKFHEKDERLFQVMQNLQEASSVLTLEYTPSPLSRALAEEFAEVEFATTSVPPNWFSNKGILSFDDVHLKAAGQFIDKEYFNVFTSQFIQGSKEQMLAGKYNIAISDELAMNIFKTTDNVIGKSVQWNLVDSGSDFTGTYIITGIFKRQPRTATAQFDILLNYELFFEKRKFLESWANSDPSTYIVLKEGVDARAFEAKIAGFLKIKNKNSSGTLFIRKYSDQYLYNSYENGVQAGGRIEYVRLFSMIAVFLLLIACINFMNLSTAKASRRLKEVGIKKAIGAGRKSLVLEYLGESMVMSFLSLLLALGFVFLFLPQFNQITGKQLSMTPDFGLCVALIAITFFTGLTAGSYPALYLSGFTPSAILKGKLNTAVGEAWARKGLVVFQFAISIVLIVSVLVVYRQVDFIRSKNLGYDRDNILQFANEGNLRKNMEGFLHEVKRIPGVVSASGFNHNLVGNHGGLSDGNLDWEGKIPGIAIDFANLEVGYDLLEMLDIEVVEGETFSRDIRPEGQIIFNEAAIESMKLADPIGKTVKLWGEDKKIVGIARDFHFESLYESIKPCIFQVYPNLNNVIVKIQGGREREAIEQIKKVYQQYNPSTPFDYVFWDEYYQALYASEERVSSLTRYFAAIAIVISCLGLFGLAAFTAERRLKEIGIRKVLGATNFGIVYLLSKEFTRIVFLSILIASPVSFFLTKRWLDQFAFRIDLEWWYFIASALVALVVAWLTVGLQAVRAASVNPTQCLKDE